MSEACRKWLKRAAPGFLAPAGDAAGLAAAVWRLAGDAALRQRMGEAARRRAADIFSAEKMHAAYDRLVRGNARWLNRSQRIPRGNRCSSLPTIGAGIRRVASIW